METATAQIVKKFDDKRDAMKYRKFILSGGAFCGFTPSFVLIDVTQSMKNLDAELESILTE